jgi:hypothetical protein
MTKHAISVSTRRKLLELERSREYRACIEILCVAVSGLEPDGDEEMVYEIGAAYLKLATYYKLIGAKKLYEDSIATAASMMPKLDALALAAIWLDENQYEPADIISLCDEFIREFDDDKNLVDSISAHYRKRVEEIRLRHLQLRHY